MTKMGSLKSLFSILGSDRYTVEEKLETIKIHRDLWGDITDEEAVDLVTEFRLYRTHENPYRYIQN